MYHIVCSGLLVILSKLENEKEDVSQVRSEAYGGYADIHFSSKSNLDSKLLSQNAQRVKMCVTEFISAVYQDEST